MGLGVAMHTRRQAMVLAAALFAGGTLLVLIALAAPRSPYVDVAGSWAVALAAATLAAVYWLGRDALPWWSLYLGMALGTAMITFGIYINGERSGGDAALNEVYYVWPVVFAAYYFPLRAFIAELLLVAVAYAAGLAIVDAGSIAPTRWLVVVTMLAGVGALIRRLQMRVRALVEQLAETARRDVVTGLLNRRGFEERLDAELARAERADRPLALVLGDVDRFKEVNDRLGHPAGDAVLLRVAEVLAGVGRRGDTVARFGGEEFVFILPDAGIDEAFALAERARHAVEAAFADEPVPLTISFGVVAFPHDGTSANALLETADRALYAAKDSGRNRTVAATVAAV